MDPDVVSPLSPVDLASVADRDDQHDQLGIVDLVQDTLGPEPNTPRISPTELRHPGWTRLLRKAADCRDDPVAVRLDNLAKRSLGASLDEDRVGHSASPSRISSTACSKDTASDG